MPTLPMKYLFLAILCCHTTLIMAQQYTDDVPQKKEEMKSLIGKGKDITGFGNLDFRVGKIKGKDALILGAYGGMLINRNVMLGIAAYGITSTVEYEIDPADPDNSTLLQINGGYAGLVLGVKIASKEIVHLSIPIVVGIGHAYVTDNSYFSLAGGDNDFIIESSNFIVIEPSLLMEINISNNFRLGLGAGYRLARGSDLTRVSESDLSGFSGVIGFQFGNF